MQFGFNLPNSGALATPEIMSRIAREGEALGYDYLTVTDHVVLPDMAEPGYPYSESGAFYSMDSAHRHEMLTLAAWLASVTASVRLVLAVLVVPHRPAVLAAKQLATIDQLSGGRLTVGIGAGWLKAEFDAVVTTPFAERGAVTDEYVAAFRTLWTERTPQIAGHYVRYGGLLLEPKPVQRPHPPIWVGGTVPEAIERVARMGFHYLNGGAAHSSTIYDDALEAHNRDPRDWRIAAMRPVYVAPSRGEAWEIAARPLHHMASYYWRWVAEARGERDPQHAAENLPTVEQIIGSQSFDFFGEDAIVGTPSDAIEQIEDYRSRGRLTDLVCALALPGMAPRDIRSGMELFAHEVIPHFRTS